MLIIKPRKQQCIQFYLTLPGIQSTHLWENEKNNKNKTYMDFYDPSYYYNINDPQFVLEYKPNENLVTKVSNVWFRPKSKCWITYHTWFKKIHSLLGHSPTWCSTILDYHIRYFFSRNKHNVAILLKQFAKLLDNSMSMKSYQLSQGIDNICTFHDNNKNKNNNHNNKYYIYIRINNGYILKSTNCTEKTKFYT